MFQTFNVLSLEFKTLYSYIKYILISITVNQIRHLSSQHSQQLRLLLLCFPCFADLLQINFGQAQSMVSIAMQATAPCHHQSFQRLYLQLHHRQDLHHFEYSLMYRFQTFWLHYFHHHCQNLYLFQLLFLDSQSNYSLVHQCFRDLLELMWT